MHQNYPELVSHLTDVMKDIHRQAPGTMRGFAACADSAKVAGVLDAKTKELMACAIAIALRCDGCLGFHTRGAVKLGANRAEMIETIGVAIMMGGGPSTVYGAHALDAYDQFVAQEPASGSA